MGTSVRCERCGFVSFATSEQCRQCGHRRPAAAVQDFSVAPWQGAPRAQGHAFAGEPSKRLAVWSLVLGIVGLFTFGLFLVGAAAGVAVGVAALVKANKRPEEYGGRGMAIGGVVLNGLLLLFVVPVAIVAAIAVPNLLAARRAANEASALHTMREVVSAEEAFGPGEGTRYISVQELYEQNLLEHEIPGGVKNGYRFEVEPHEDHFVVHATPTNYPNTGTRSFYFSSKDGVIRAADKRGRPAGDDDAPLRESAAPGARIIRGGPNRPDLIIEPRSKEDYTAESQ